MKEQSEALTLSMPSSQYPAKYEDCYQAVDPPGQLTEVTADGVDRGGDLHVVQLAAVGALVVDHQLELLDGVDSLQAVVPAVLQHVLPGVVVDDALVDVLEVGDVDDGAAELRQRAAAYLEVELAQWSHPAVVTLGWPERDFLDDSQAQAGAGEGEQE